MTRSIQVITGAMLIAIGALGSAHAQAQTQRSPRPPLPACSDVEPGQPCQTNAGQRVRRPETSEFNGGDVGFARPEIGDEVVVQHSAGDPDRPVINGRVMNGTDEAPDNADRLTRFGGADVGFAVREGNPDTDPARFGGADVGFATDQQSPKAEQMECELCDDDEDEPQDTGGNTPGTGRRTSDDAPDEEDPEDCEWNNPAGGPDQENCDE
jgi:hypothetical protein